MTTKQQQQNQVQTQAKKKPEDTRADFHGAAIIDNEGHEVPITEKMVKQACDKLEDNRNTS